MVQSALSRRRKKSKMLHGQSGGNKVKIGGMLAGNSKASESGQALFLKRVVEDINYYFKLLGFSPTHQQQELVDSFVANEPRIAVRSGKGPGKTTVTAVLIPWWSLTRYQSNALITAPTMDQCRNVWLAEAQRWIMNGDKKVQHFFTFTNSGYGIRGNPAKIWGGRLRTASKPENLQGIHRENLLIYMEEASGLSHAIMQTIQDTLSGNKDVELYGGQNRALAVGNPNTRTCRFFDFFHSLKDNPWTCLHWNAEETPDSAWFSQERNKEIADEFGIDSDIYRVAVLGEFPSLDPDNLISEQDLEACFGPEAYDRAFKHPDNTKQIGMDLARFGGDELVTVFRNGRIVIDFDARNHVEPHIMIDRAVMLQDQYQWKDSECVYAVDTSGMGEAAVGPLADTRKLGKKVHEFHSHGRAVERTKYADKITEAWCGFAKKVRSGELYLGAKRDNRLIQQLSTRKYFVTKDGLIKIESKDDYKKRMQDNDNGTLGKSPDRADGIVIAFYDHATQTQRVSI